MSISSALTGIYLGTHTMIEQRWRSKEQKCINKALTNRTGNYLDTHTMKEQR